MYASLSYENGCVVYRYDGNGAWTALNSEGILIPPTSVSTPESTPFIDSISVMKVFDGKLFVGTRTNTGEGAVYTYNPSQSTDRGWTRLNATLGTFGSTTGVDGVASMAVVNGTLFIGTRKTNDAEVYRYEGGTTLTLTNGSSTGGLSTVDPSGDVIDAINLVNYGGRLFAGLETGTDSAARVYRWGGADWFMLNTTAGRFETTTGINDVTSLITYNGSLFIGVADGADSAEIYRYNGNPDSGSHTSVAFTRVSGSTPGILATSTDVVDSIRTFTVYNGRLYAGTDTGSGTNKGAIYEFDGVSSWSVLNPSGEGNFGENSIDGVSLLLPVNDSLYVGTVEPAASTTTNVYYFKKTSSNSYALQFTADGDGSFDNIGSISFMAGDQSSSTFANQGQFLVSHSFSFTAAAYDIAEDYATLDDEVESGSVVAIDPENPGGYVRAANINKGDGLRLLGIVSTKPALRLSQKLDYDPISGSRTLPVALAGRVPVKVDPESEDIKPGDFLTASTTRPGYATKADNGFVIAKALESWNKGSDKTLDVFVTNAFAATGQIAGMSPAESRTLTDGQVSVLDAFAFTVDGGLRMLKDINFIGKVFFENEVTFKDRVFYGDKDFAGYAAIEAGDKEVRIKYKKPYAEKPIVSVSPKSLVQYHIEDETPEGFVIKIDQPSDKQIQFSWIALQVKDSATYNSKDVTSASN